MSECQHEVKFSVDSKSLENGEDLHGDCLLCGEKLTITEKEYGGRGSLKLKNLDLVIRDFRKFINERVIQDRNFNGGMTKAAMVTMCHYLCHMIYSVDEEALRNILKDIAKEKKEGTCNDCHV